MRRQIRRPLLFHEQEELDEYLLEMLDQAFNLDGETKGYDSSEFCRDLDEKLIDCLEREDCRSQLLTAIQVWIREWSREKEKRKLKEETLIYV